jgi:hypothetical protein
MEFVVRTIARSSIEDWDRATCEELWHATDEAGRSLLSVVARGVLTGQEVTDTAAADFVQLTPRENTGVIRELNDAARAANRPSIINPTMVTESLPNGRLREKRVLLMPPDVAEFVRDLARAERASSVG